MFSVGAAVSGDVDKFVKQPHAEGPARRRVMGGVSRRFTSRQHVSALLVIALDKFEAREQQATPRQSMD